MKKKPYIIIVCLILCLSLLTGCQNTGSIFENFRAVEALLPTQVLGIDGDSGKVILSCAAAPEEAGELPMRLWAEGSNIDAALEHLQNYTPREEPFFAHVQYILAGETMARQGLRPLLDFLARSPTMRMNTPLLAVRNDSAKTALLESGGEGSDIIRIIQSLEQFLTVRGESYLYSCRDIARALAEKGTALCCAVEIRSLEDILAEEQDPGLTIIPAGYGIIQNGKLTGFLEGDAARGASLALGHLALLTVELPCGAVVGLDGCDLRWKPHWTEGRLDYVEAEGLLRAVVSGLETDMDLLDPAVTARLDQELSEVATRWLRDALNATARLGADCLGLGEALQASDPAAFDALGDNWLQGLTIRLNLQGMVSQNFNAGGMAPVEGGAVQ